MSSSTLHCDGCGLAIKPGGGTNCPRCGYPIDDAKEEVFLHKSIRDLQRVAQYGGANITVAHLIDRYQYRLAFLTQRIAMSSLSANLPVQTQIVPVVQVPVKEREEHNSSHYRPEMPGPLAHHEPDAQALPSRQMFSARAFFADQTINIVASLGAFLILIGSLSFIVTTSDLLLAFIILLLVHAIFGGIGAVTYRFASLRTVSVIYTAIFTLQVPLVGFAAYRFAAGPAFHVSTSLLIAAAASYAAGVYGVLAVYQKFKPFGYLAAVALLVVDLATASTLQLAAWWWPSMLMLLAFPLLFFIRRSIHPSPARNVLREPAKVLLGVCVTGSILFTLMITLFMLMLSGQESAQGELRFSIVVVLLLLSGWLALLIWSTKRYELMALVPYLCIACVLALLYAFYTPHIGYVLTLTALAFLFCALARLPLRTLNGPENRFAQNLEILALIIVSIMPFIAVPDLLMELMYYAYAWPHLVAWVMPFDIVADIVALLLGCILTLSVLVRHTGWRKVLTAKQAEWCWLLLLCGLIFNYVYALVVVTFDMVPVWAMLGFFLLCAALAVCARRFLSSSWANPLDVLSLCVFGEVLLLGFNLDPGSSIALLLFLSGLFYALASYQRRRSQLFSFLICALLALPHLFMDAATTLLALALLLPLVSVGVQHILLFRQQLAQSPQHSVFAWIWPLLLMSIVYGTGIVMHDSANGVSTLGSSVPVVVELAALALVWYIAALLVQNKWWSGVALGFALWGVVLVPQTFACQYAVGVGAYTAECVHRGQITLYSLTGIAMFSAICGLCIDWFMKYIIKATPGRLYRQIKWSWPWYAVALGALVVLLIWSGNAAEMITSDLLTVFCGLVVAALVFMLVTRVPELLVLVAVLAVRTIASTPWLFWQQMSAYSVLCLLLFTAQLAWRFLTPTSHLYAPARLSAVLALGGQLLVVLMIILMGGLFATAGVLAHVGAASLAAFALLLFWWGYLQTAYMRVYVYVAGLLCSLVVSWELSALAQTQLSTLWLAPAAYLIVLAPFLSRDEKLPGHRQAGQLCSIAGAMFLLLPTLWLSFSQNNLQPSLLLAGEALLLLLLGLVTRIRIFVLSCVGLIIVTAIHVLFLPSLGIPTFLALLLMGILLLVAATGLVLVRSRLATLWTVLE